MFLINEARFTVAVPPAYLNGMEMLAAEEVLDSKLLSFDERLGGLLVAYESLKYAEGGYGLAQDEQPDVLFRFKARLVLFCPKKGETYAATVSDIQAGHVTLLMAGVFPVVVRASEYPTGVSLAENGLKTLVDEAGDPFVALGMECKVKCVKVAVKNSIINVEATFDI